LTINMDLGLRRLIIELGFGELGLVMLDDGGDLLELDLRELRRSVMEVKNWAFQHIRPLLSRLNHIIDESFDQYSLARVAWYAHGSPTKKPWF